MLDDELGPGEMGPLLAAQGLALLWNETLVQTTRDVSEAAAALGIPIVLLKGMALQWTGRTRAGARWASDVDILVSEEGLAPLATALEERGYRADRGGPPCDHQLPGFQRGPGENVDVHRYLPGVRLPGHRGFADFGALKASGLLEPLPDFVGSSHVPAAPVLAAHTLVHGIAQHGFAPQSYPLLRMVSDLVDLGVGSQSARAMWTRAVAFTRGHVTAAEAAATWDLCELLVSGSPLPSLLSSDSDPAHALLAHALAGALDATYRDSLRLRVFGSTPSVLPRPLPWLRDVARSLWPSRAQLEALNGGGRARSVGAFAARVSRPLVQVGRALRSGWSLVRVLRRRVDPAVESPSRRA